VVTLGVPLAPLPIDSHLGSILDALATRGAVVVAADPGAGKTTRVPRGMLLDPRFAGGEILVLEPRRIAARMAAARVAHELGEALGERIGYSVRSDTVGSARTRVRFVTEGILTRRFATDPTLAGVRAVVLDELHERSLHADLALAVVRRLRANERPDLAVIAMSATLERERVATFLDATVVQVPGRAFPVEIEHAPSRDDRKLEERVASACARALREDAEGDVLVFLPGAGEIRRADDAVRTFAARAGADVVPLHGELSADAQDRAVRPGSRRKVILSTNVAETSLTIDGVTVVVDSGLHRLARHSPWSGLPLLEVAPISQASATQRAGRAGRTRAGRAIRLYTQHDHDARPRFDVPEIARADLAELVLVLAGLGVRDASTFPFFEAPSAVAIEAARSLLARLGAIDASGAITTDGSQLLALPLHPRLGRIALAARDDGLAAEGALLVSTLAEREIRASHRTRFGDRDAPRVETDASDAVDRMEALAGAEASGASRSSFASYDLDPRGASAALTLRDQIVRALDRTRRGEPRYAPDADAALMRAILAGFSDRVGRRRKKGSSDVVLAGGGSVKLAETSVVRDAELMVCVEADEARGGAICRIASAIEPEWLLELHPDHVTDVRTFRFDLDKERLELVTGLAYDGLTIDESRGDAVGEPGAAAALAKEAMARDLGRFVDRNRLTQLRLRATLARKADATLPSFDEAAVERALIDACEGRRSLAELAKADVLGAMESAMTFRERQRFEELAPTSVTLPGRAKVDVTYELDRPPWMESRMQDFFGLVEGPRAGGAPIVLHLLAPNGRAVQVTTDLAGFWDRHYPSIRKELMRQYPRHHWPDDPRTASPRKPKP
jgi:ATP-dependent helicase HrpB